MRISDWSSDLCSSDLRLFIDDAEVINAPEQNFGTSPAMAGDIKFIDVNNDGQVTTLDQVAIGYPKTPEIVYGFGASTGYKNFDFSLFFQGSARSSFWIDYSATAPFISSGSGLIRQTQLLKAYANDQDRKSTRLN